MDPALVLYPYALAAPLRDLCQARQLPRQARSRGLAASSPEVAQSLPQRSPDGRPTRSRSARDSGSPALERAGHSPDVQVRDRANPESRMNSLARAGLHARRRRRRRVHEPARRPTSRGRRARKPARRSARPPLRRTSCSHWGCRSSAPFRSAPRSTRRVFVVFPLPARTTCARTSPARSRAEAQPELRRQPPPPPRPDRSSRSGVSHKKTDAQVEAGRADYALDGVDPPTSRGSLLATAPGAPPRDARQAAVLRHPRLGLDFISLNTNRPLFSRRAARRAVNYAIDRRALGPARQLDFNRARSSRRISTCLPACPASRMSASTRSRPRSRPRGGWPARSGERRCSTPATRRPATDWRRSSRRTSRRSASTSRSNRSRRRLLCASRPDKASRSTSRSAAGSPTTPIPTTSSTS